MMYVAEKWECAMCGDPKHPCRLEIQRYKGVGESPEAMHGYLGKCHQLNLCLCDYPPKQGVKWVRQSNEEVE